MTLWGTPGWANGGAGPNVAPRNAADFRRFAVAVAQRYRFVDRWIMWNEPNKPTWLKPASARTYVSKILNPGYEGIKSVGRRDQVAGGVTGPRAGKGGVTPVDFIRYMDRLGARLDAYAHHPYPVFPGDTPFLGGCVCEILTMAKIERLLFFVRKAFPGARVWLTEYAYQTSPPDSFGVSLDDQARFIGEAARRVYLAAQVDMLIHYLYRDEPEMARWQSGLETVSGKAKPSLNATMLPLAQVSRKAGNDLDLGPGPPRQRAAAVRPPAQHRGRLGRGRPRAANRRARLLQAHGRRRPGHAASDLVPRAQARERDAARPLGRA